jgi:hypothetical protein
MTAEDFDAAIARFETVAGGEVRINDFFSHTRAPYRCGCLYVRMPRESPVDLPQDRIVQLVSQLAVLAVEVGAYLTMNVHPTAITVQLHVSRDLDADEIGDDPPVAIRDVAR